MIPPVVLVGFLVGLFVPSRISLRRAVILAVATALFFGLGIGMSDGDLGLVAGAALLSLANFAAGALIGAAVGQAAVRLAGDRQG